MSEVTQLLTDKAETILRPLTARPEVFLNVGCAPVFCMFLL